MTAYRDVTSKKSGLYETCARHTARQTSYTLQTIFLCDDCTRRMVAETFNGRAPLYHGEELKGFCGLCNAPKQIAMRQWFVCNRCWPVVLSYQKSIAASAGVHEWWKSKVAPLFPKLTLIESEPVSLQPYARQKMTKLQNAASLEILDFLVQDESANPAAKRFHIEQKTGPSSIESMKEFQLDVNDFNDIAGAMNATKIPSYVVHVQVTFEYSFPTRRAVVGSMWWTDLFTLQDHKKRVATRRGEDKKAIYFKPGAFKAIDTFADEIKNRGYDQLRTRLEKASIELIR